MNSPHAAIAAASTPARGPAPLLSPPFRWLICALVVIVLGFSRSLYDLARLSLNSELYSYVPLVPFISLYIVWLNRDRLAGTGLPHRRLGAFLLAGAGLTLGVYWLLRPSLAAGSGLDRIAVTTLSFVLAIAGACAWFAGRPAFQSLRFPLMFLAFMIPIPGAALGAVETFLQHGSAVFAKAFFSLAGSTYFAQGLVIELPGITLHVAPECSGIRSTLVLFIVSVLTGHFFLRSAAGCILLSLAVLPLALLRNGFRIFTIGELCTRIGPEMIDSYIHRQGGPIFFVLSLVPFLLLLVILLRWERRRFHRHAPAAVHPLPGR